MEYGTLISRTKTYRGNVVHHNIKTNDMQNLIIIALISCILSSCNTSVQKQIHEIKNEQIINVIGHSGFLELPLIFDANNENSLRNTYNVDFKGNDTLLFDTDIYSIIGFLPDTTDYYGFLFHTVGDMLYPTLMTLDKKGNKIDRQIINATGCAGHFSLDVTSCYDSVWIHRDLTIKSISRVIGTVDSEDIPEQTLNICNMRRLDGLIEKNGRIKLTRSEIIDCNEMNNK